MNKARDSEQARRELDRRFSNAGAASRWVRPHSGWIKAIRMALGMTQANLAARLGVSQAAVKYLEDAESNHGITLGKLAEVAEAMDCTLVYALVPKTSLEETVQRQARRLALVQLGYVAGTMSLEDQAVLGDGRAAHIDVYARDLIAANELWRSVPVKKRDDPDPSVDG